MSRRANVVRHGQNHACGGSDPIPGICDLQGLLPTSFADFVTDLKSTYDLRGYWRLGDGASPFADTSGHSYGAADAVKVSGGTAMTDSVTGGLPASQDDGAVQFNSTDGSTADYLDCPDPSPRRFNFGSGDEDMTITALVKPTASANGFSGMVIGCWVFGSSATCGWRLDVEWPARTVLFQRAQNGGTSMSLTSPGLIAGEWAVIAASYSTARGHNLYVNGVKIASDATTFTGLPTFNTGPNIGASNDVTSFKAFCGAVDEITVWGDDLGDDNIAALSAAAQITDSFLSVISVSSAYTATSSDDVILANGTFTVTLPTAAGILGKQIVVKNVGSGTITVDGNGSETVDGNATATLTAGDFITIVSDGTNWVTSGSGPPTGVAGGVLSGTYPNPGFAVDMATQAELDAHITDTSAAHAASAISVADTAGNFAATDVEGALAELADPSADTKVWMPLTTTVGGDDVLVFDANHSLIPTLVSF